MVSLEKKKEKAEEGSFLEPPLSRRNGGEAGREGVGGVRARPEGAGVRRVYRGPCRLYNRTCIPSSTTRLTGIRKKSVGRWALRTIRANSFSRQIAIPGFLLGISVSRLRK